MPTRYKDVPPEELAQRLLSKDILKKEDWEALLEVRAILTKFWDLSVRAEGTKIQEDRGILPDYITTLNDLLNHVQLYRDDLNIRADNEELSTPAIQQNYGFYGCNTIPHAATASDDEYIRYIKEKIE
jgi:hypothetical protein